jgi:hypothetical protein
MMASPRRVSRPGAYRCSNVLDGRPGIRLEADWGHVSVLEGGGHICELNLRACGRVNPLWRPPWKTIDPTKYRVAQHSRIYGRLPDGRLLAGIAGHNLSFDYFGPPSKEEVAAGHSTHGEAPSIKWQTQRLETQPRPFVRYGALLPEAHIRFMRELSLHRSQAIIYYQETATNLSSFDRPISWNEHVTFGPPFVEAGVTLFDMPATHGKVCPAAYSSRPLLRADAEFHWPMAPEAGRGRINLRTIPDSRFEHYTAQLLDPKFEFAFTSACNARLGLLVVYLFRRADFPWVGSWNERFHQAHAPWRKRTFCRGVEFSTTPFAIPRRETVDQNRLFGERTFRWLPAKSELKVRYLTLLFEVPGDFGGVREVAVAPERVIVTEAGRRARTLTAQTGTFL